MRVHLKMYFIDSNEQARQTNMTFDSGNAKATRIYFNTHRERHVAAEESTFMMDLYNGRGDLEDTILLNDHGFRAITGQQPKAEAEYLEIDRRYWDDARRERGL